MAGVPSLFNLSVTAVVDELVHGDDNDVILSAVYDLPPELFDRILPRLPPLALQKLQENLPIYFGDNFEQTYDYGSNSRKRRRCGILDTAWQALYNTHWPGFSQLKQDSAWWGKDDETKHGTIDDWRQKYWEAHLQACVDAVAEIAMLPSYDGSIEEIHIPDGILDRVGCKRNMIKLECNYLKLSYHCQQFGVYARYLRLPNALCVPETCDLLKSIKLGRLELQWIKSSDHIEALCKILDCNCETLKSVDFIHCKLSPTFINAICDSLQMKGSKIHRVEHLSIKRSSFLQADSSPIPDGLASFLTSGRSLHSLTLCDDQIGRNFARMVFSSLLDASDSISTLDLSENNISGFLSQFRWRSYCSRGTGKSMLSLRVLNLRCCNLVSDDADCLRQALVHMPNLEKLDLSDNPIEDGVRSLILYFTEISDRDVPFVSLELENCDLTCKRTIQLLGVLSTMKNPLNALSIKGNRLGSEVGTHLGKLLCTGICALNVEDIGLGSSGFLEALREMSSSLRLTYLNISNNQGGIEASKFISGLISRSPEIVAIDSRYNLMPMDSLSIISTALKTSKGKLEHLDLAGNSFCELADAASVFSGFRVGGQFFLDLSLSAASNEPYDDEP